MKERLLTVEEVATLLQVHWQTVLNYIKRGDLRAVKLGRGYRIEPSALATFIQNNSTSKDSK